MPLVQVKKDASVPMNNLQGRNDSVVACQAKEEERTAQRDFAEPRDDFFGKEKWDAGASWTQEEERRVVRKTDLHLMLFFCLLIVGVQIDKANLFGALTDNFLDDIQTNTNDYDNALMLSKVGLILSELPNQLLVLRYGFRGVVPPLIMCWGVVCMYR